MSGSASAFGKTPRYYYSAYFYSDDETNDKPTILSPAIFKQKDCGSQITLVDANDKKSGFIPKLTTQHYSYPDRLGRDCNRLYRLIMHDDEQHRYTKRKRKVLKALKSISKKDYTLAKCALRSIYDHTMERWRILQRFNLLEYEYYARLSEITLAIQKMNLPPVVPEAVG